MARLTLDIKNEIMFLSPFYKSEWENEHINRNTYYIRLPDSWLCILFNYQYHILSAKKKITFQK